MQQPIASDSTLADIAETLRQAEEFVRRILANMHESQKENKTDVYVRIGITGRGIIPHYRIEGPYVPEVTGPFADVINIYNGSNHKVMWDVPEDALREEHWSTKTMDLTSVALLRKALADAKKKRP